MPDSTKELRAKAAKLRALARQVDKAAGVDKEAHRERMAERSRAESRDRREIGPLPPVKDQARRDACERDLERFGLTYFPKRFGWPFAECHRDAMERSQTCTHEGGQFANAMPRGSGKTAIAEVEVIRAIVYGHRRFAVLLQATESLGAKSLRKIKRELETNPLLLEDFPEVCYPIRRLEGIHNRANGQTLNGKPTRIEWTAHSVTLPTVEGSAASGSVIWVGGITGAVRGLSANTPDGGIMRPDLVLIDDAQTRDTAKSLSQTNDLELIIAGDVLGLAGPDVQIAAMMLCTVIYPNDLSERHLDNEKAPEWQGIRTKMLVSFPKRMDLWDQYAEVRRDGLRARDKGAAANEFYIANQADMDDGAAVSWPARVKTGEVSAIQGAMNLYYKNPTVFRAEYQNEPEPIDVTHVSDLIADDIAARMNGSSQSMVPIDSTQLAAFIDAGSQVLFYVVTAWNDSFTGHVIDYGTYPRQNRSYFVASDARPSLADVFPTLDETARLYAGLKALTKEILERNWQRDGKDGGEDQIGICLIDSGWEAKTVLQFCRQSPYRSRLLASKGHGITVANAPISEWKLRHPAERKGDNWRLRPVPERLLVYDANYWKTFVAQRLLAPIGSGSMGTLQLFGNDKDPSRHQLFAEHCTSEYRVRTSGRGRTIEEWKIRPTQTNNHWWDCLVGTAVGASIQGVKWSAAAAVGDPPEPPKPKKERRSLLAEFHARSAEKNGGYFSPR